MATYQRNQRHTPQPTSSHLVNTSKYDINSRKRNPSQEVKTPPLGNVPFRSADVSPPTPIQTKNLGNPEAPLLSQVDRVRDSTRYHLPRPSPGIRISKAQSLASRKCGFDQPRKCLTGDLTPTVLPLHPRLLGAELLTIGLLPVSIMKIIMNYHSSH